MTSQPHVSPTMEDVPVGQKTVRFSDFSGQLILEDSALARIVVHEHPELGDSPVEFEALGDEARTIEKSAVQVAVVDLYFPGDEEPRRVAMNVDEFDRLATDKPMGELLAAARPARRTARTTAAAAPREPRVNYATLEHAGKPHKGKTTEAEKRLVREHLTEINDRLSGENLRPINLSDPEHVERYGLEALVPAASATASDAAAEMTAEPFDDDLANERNDRTSSAA